MHTAADQKSVTASEAEQELRSKAVKYIRFEQSDLMGLSRSKTIPIDAFGRFAMSGVNFYGGTIGLDSASIVVPNTGLGEEVGYQDSRLIPDLSTLQILPWEPHTASVLCTPCFANTGDAMPQSPRNVYLSLLEKAQQLGFVVRAGLELEFYLLDAQTKEPVTQGPHIFATSRNHWSDFINRLLDNLNELGLRLITHNAEYGPGQFEINFAPSDGIAAADDAFRFKTAVKELANCSGYLATFMSKPKTDWAGSGCHVHMGLRNIVEDSNAFVDTSQADALSQTARQFTAGVLQHAHSIMPLIAPTVNCYHRFIKGSFAPSRAGWGIEDRTALIRVKASGDDATHIEMRGATGLSNPYISASATLAAGLLGIEGKYALPQTDDALAENNEQFTLLPKTLERALEAFEADEKLCNVLGKPFSHLFCTVKKFEIERWRAHISNWEVNEYRELY